MEEPVPVVELINSRSIAPIDLTFKVVPLKTRIFGLSNGLWLPSRKILDAAGIEIPHHIKWKSKTG
ncbi:MAG: hypothetical protein R2773_02100 [Flavobacteriaceae bacterium]